MITKSIHGASYFVHSQHHSQMAASKHSAAEDTCFQQVVSVYGARKWSIIAQRAHEETLWTGLRWE